MIRRLTHRSKDTSSTKDLIKRKLKSDKLTEVEAKSHKDGVDGNLRKFKDFDEQKGMSDLIKDHQPNSPFQFATITDKMEDRNSRFNRFKNKIANVNFTSKHLDNLPFIYFYKPEEPYSLMDALGVKCNIKEDEFGMVVKTQKVEKMRFIMLEEVVVQFGTLISYDDSFSQVFISLLDNRKLKNKVAKRVIANTNLGSTTIFSLSYCVPMNEIYQVKLVFSHEVPFLEEGSMWGSAQVYIKYRITDFPQQVSNEAAFVTHRVPQGVLEDRKIDPDYLDITTEENDREKLRGMYLEEELVDIADPIHDTTDEKKVAKSSIAGPRGKRIGQGGGYNTGGEWDSIFNARRNTRAVDNSIEPSDDGSFGVSSPTVAPRKSAMKKATFRAEVEELSDREINVIPNIPDRP